MFFFFFRILVIVAILKQPMPAFSCAALVLQMYKCNDKSFAEISLGLSSDGYYSKQDAKNIYKKGKSISAITVKKTETLQNVLRISL